MFEDGTELPKELEARFEVISMLKQDGEGTLTCLAASRENGDKVLLKVACEAGDAVQLWNEKEILEAIGGREGFPEVIGAGTEPTAWLARTWVEGRTVESMVESRTKAPGVSREQALDCAIAVAEKLVFLHGMNPPIIHRDVKPQNVVMDGEGKYHLIDMGISRAFREGSRMDTQISGTRATAPPEQYGYRQTDERSDVFSLGVLLRYAMTGEYAEEGDAQLPRDVRTIVEKATRFDPEQRYQSAQEMLGALVAARFGGELQPGRKKGRAVVWALCAGLAVCVLLLAFTIPAAWRQDVFRGLEARLGTAYTFREPLIEEAVRQELAKPEGEITYADLEQVTAIHIYGKQIYKNEDSFWFRAQYDYCRDDAMRESGLYLENGGIRSLEDILRMPNLRELSLYNQEISDLSALKDTRIHRLGIGHNPIVSLEPLRGNQEISYLNIEMLEIPSLNVLSTMGGLRTLNISGMAVRSLALLEDVPLRELNMFGVEIDNVKDYGLLHTWRP